VTKTLKTLDREPFLNRRVMLAGAVIATAGVAGSLLYSAIYGPRVDRSKPRPRPTGKKLPIEDLIKPGPLPDLVIGQADAPVTIIEYADLSCPACANFHSKVLPVLKEKYIDKGQVRILFREFPANTLSMLASMTARCVPGEDKAITLVSALFTRQEDWAKSKSIDELRGKLYNVGQQVGLTRQAFNACMPTGGGDLKGQAKKLFEDLSAARDRAHNGFGVNQTPTFFINNRKLEGATAEDFDKAIAPLLEKK
jgi:protein-disulfide isomerase